MYREKSPATAASAIRAIPVSTPVNLSEQRGGVEGGVGGWGYNFENTAGCGAREGSVLAVASLVV